MDKFVRITFQPLLSLFPPISLSKYGFFYPRSVLIYLLLLRFSLNGHLPWKWFHQNNFPSEEIITIITRQNFILKLHFHRMFALTTSNILWIYLYAMPYHIHKIVHSSLWCSGYIYKHSCSNHYTLIHYKQLKQIHGMYKFMLYSI